MDLAGERARARLHWDRSERTGVLVPKIGKDAHVNNQKFNPRTSQMKWWTIGALIFVACSVYALIVVPGALVAHSLQAGSGTLNTPERVAAINDARQGVLLAIGGFVAIVTLLFTRVKHLLDEKKLVLEQDANWTSRYTEAVAQLGDDSSASIRLGGIYSLERIAQDSPRDRQTVLDLMCAYLRDKSPVSATGAVATREVDEKVTRIPTEYAAAVTVVVRITRLSQPTNVVDLHDANLTGADLSGAKLGNANLRGANLTSANLSDVDFSGARLDKATLAESNLNRSDFRGARLTGANLKHAKLNHAKFSSANLSKADLTRAELVGADFTGADFTRAVLKAAAFSRANLVDASIFVSTDTSVTRTAITKTYLREQGALEVDSVNGLPDEKTAITASS